MLIEDRLWFFSVLADDEDFMNVLNNSIKILNLFNERISENLSDRSIYYNLIWWFMKIWNV